ncbi:NUDIX hydrolase [Mycobacterium sp.]|uniref:NUDIX hydrolase n=1 Tax=Mycobacterium sp. TaxID=1785 RepID=UPI002D63AE88|nr:NUDIX hydrolase [Mycobacterium sp.]HZA11061.1 NUDIX hydrolase [Mycobacterium sp.]
MAEHDFETASSEIAYIGNILALRVDKVKMPGGGTATREVVEHFGAVAVAAVDDEHKIAMVYQYRHPVGRRLWELPAGLLDTVGEDPHTTAARELKEEAGLAATTWRVLVDTDSSPGFSDESVRTYLATGLSRVDRPAAEDEEADLRLEWFPLEKAVEMVLAGEVVNASAAAGVLAAHAVVIDGKPTRPVDAAWPDRPTAFARRKGR